MKKMLRKMSTFTLGLIVGVTFTGATAVGAATYLKATQSNVKIVVDGTQAKLSESPLNVNGKLYLPVRDTANAMGYSVESVSSTQVSLKEGVSASSTSNSSSTVDKTGSAELPSQNTNTTTSKKVKNLKDTYSTDGKLDAEKIRTALNNGSLDVNAQDSDDGNTLLHYVVMEENYEAFKAIKRNALNVNLKNLLGQTPIMITVIEDKGFYFGEIRDLKPDLNITDNSGKKVIDLADPKSTYYSTLRGDMLFSK
ncbi:stalk domain-containing protein [Paenibacillus taichungensis]|uniref:stalk domain-containing protein n=1 Tax=Paenibacillus taichungensis TaxID=484184 RepID=UPI0039A088CD